MGSFRFSNNSFMLRWIYFFLGYCWVYLFHFTKKFWIWFNLILIVFEISATVLCLARTRTHTIFIALLSNRYTYLLFIFKNCWNISPNKHLRKNGAVDNNILVWNIFLDFFLSYFFIFFLCFFNFYLIVKCSAFLFLCFSFKVYKFMA